MAMTTYQSRLTPFRRRVSILHYVGAFIVGAMIALAICFTLALILGEIDNFASSVIGMFVFPILGMGLGVMGTLSVAKSQR